MPPEAKKITKKLVTWERLKQLASDKNLHIESLKTPTGWNLRAKYGRIIYISDVTDNPLEQSDIVETVVSTKTQAASIHKVRQHKLVRWDNDDIAVGNSSFQDVYSITGSAIFMGCIFHLNTDDMYFRVVIDDVTTIDLDLKEVKEDFVLASGSSSVDDSGRGRNGSVSSRIVGCIGLREYDNKRWAYCPPVPIDVVVSLKIQMKCKSGSKKIYRGLSSLVG